MSDKLRATLLLIISLALLAVGGWFTYTGEQAVVASACNRSGLILFAIWLALPQLRKFKWTGSVSIMIGLAICGLTLAIRPRAIYVVGPVLLAMGALQFVGWLFAPMPKRSASKPTRKPGKSG